MKNEPLKLTKGEIAGIRLVADVFVAKEITEHLKTNFPETQGLADYMREQVPELNVIELELTKQISQARQEWLKSIKEARKHDSA